MYSNRSFKSILEVSGYDWNNDPFNDELKRKLANCMIRKFGGFGKTDKETAGGSDTTNIWSFIAQNQKGATF